MERRLLACPRCGSKQFQVYLATCKGFFGQDRHLNFELHKCCGCGWESHPSSEEQIRHLLLSILRGEFPEGFVFA
jgi:hypothetical protein